MLTRQALLEHEVARTHRTMTRAASRNRDPTGGQLRRRPRISAHRLPRFSVLAGAVLASLGEL